MKIKPRKEFDFRRAFAPISMRVPWVHHGRDGTTGLDCVGLIFEVFRNVGLPLDDLDVPYGIRDADRPRVSLIVRQLEKRFDRLNPQTPREVQDGDVLLIGPVHDNHVAVVVGGVAAEMSSKRLRFTKLSLMWGFVTSVYRHREVAISRPTEKVTQ